MGRRHADDTLQWAKDPGGNQLAGFKYEAGALRRRKASNAAAEGDRVYVYDGSSLVAELDAATGAPKLEYIYGAELWGVIDYSASSTNPTVQWMHRDGMRSVVERTANLGSGATRVAGPFRYDAFGGYRTTPEAVQPGADGQSKVGYTGHVFDVETGLVYAKARYYQPELGRWLSQDALEGQMDRAPSLNRYSYASMSPYRYWDPSGYDGIPLFNFGLPPAYRNAETAMWAARNETVRGASIVVAGTAAAAAGAYAGAPPLAVGAPGAVAGAGGGGLLASAKAIAASMWAATGGALIGLAVRAGDTIVHLAEDISVSGPRVALAVNGPALTENIVEPLAMAAEDRFVAGSAGGRTVEAAEQEAARLRPALETPKPPPARVPVPTAPVESPAIAGEAVIPPDGAPEPEVQRFIAQFKARYPGRAFQSGHSRATSDNRDVEIDFETDNAIIEFKRSRGQGLTHQIEDRMDPAVNPGCKVCIGVACSPKGISPHVRNDVERAGGLAASSSQTEELLDLLAPDGQSLPGVK